MGWNRSSKEAGEDRPAAATTASATVFAQRYLLEEAVPHDAGSAVWRATDERSGEPVALKFFPAHLIRTPADFLAVRNVIAPVRRLRHRCAVPAREVATDSGYFAVVTPWIDGPTLEEWQQENERPFFDYDEIELLLHDLIDVMDAAQGRGIVHGALTPRVIFASAEGQLRVTAFGINAWLRLAQGATGTTPKKTGSAQYASPAVLAGAAPEIVDDVYSFGVIVYQLLAGSLPRAASRWNRRAGPVVSMTRQRRKHGKVASRAGEIPAVWESLVQACLDPDPARRPPNFRAIRSQLGPDWAPQGEPEAEEPQVSESGRAEVATPPPEEIRANGTPTPEPHAANGSRPHGAPETAPAAPAPALAEAESVSPAAPAASMTASVPLVEPQETDAPPTSPADHNGSGRPAEEVHVTFPPQPRSAEPSVRAVEPAPAPAKQESEGVVVARVEREPAPTPAPGLAVEPAQPANGTPHADSPDQPAPAAASSTEVTTPEAAPDTISEPPVARATLSDAAASASAETTTPREAPQPSPAPDPSAASSPPPSAHAAMDQVPAPAPPVASASTPDFPNEQADEPVAPVAPPAQVAPATANESDQPADAAPTPDTIRFPEASPHAVPDDAAAATADGGAEVPPTPEEIDAAGRAGTHTREDAAAPAEAAFAPPPSDVAHWNSEYDPDPGSSAPPAEATTLLPRRPPVRYIPPPEEEVRVLYPRAIFDDRERSPIGTFLLRAVLICTLLATIAVGGWWGWSVYQARLVFTELWRDVQLLPRDAPASEWAELETAISQAKPRLSAEQWQTLQSAWERRKARMQRGQAADARSLRRELPGPH